mgnify:CR=1 FL=1
MEHKIGLFQVGMAFDAVLVDTFPDSAGTFDVFDDEGVLEAFQKYLFTGDDRNVKEVYVQGRQIKK